MSEVELQDCLLLVMANKQDLPNARDPSQLSEILELDSIKQRHHIQGTVAHSAEGLFDALDWLSEEFQGKGKKKAKK